MTIQLREVRLEDAEIVHKWKCDPYMIKMALDDNHPSTLQMQEQDIKRSLSSSSIYRMIECSNKLVGYIRVDWMNHEHTYGWLRFGLGEDRNKGIMRTALKQELSLLKEQGVYRMECEVYEYNKPSLTLLKRIGFQVEGTKRDAHQYKGSFYNIYVLGLIMEEYPSG